MTGFPSTLPAELLCLVVGFLDPISLIALSQTSRFFRHFISPTHTHFSRRLLALELLPEHGGIVPLFRGRDNRLSPPWDDPQWQRNRYACCGCLKLLPHTRFDNHSILRMPLRKPPPGSRETENMKLACWEPRVQGNAAARRKRMQAPSPEEQERVNQAKLQYHLAATGRLAPAIRFDVVNMGPIDTIAEEAEKLLCGVARHRRRCNECRRRHGGYAGQPFYRALVVPIIKSRQLEFPDALSRSFPGLLDPVAPRDLPRLFRHTRPGRKGDHYNLYAACCPSCLTWLEIAAFSFYNPIPPYFLGLSHEFGPSGWPTLCYLCLLKRLGRDNFGKKLAKNAILLTDRAISDAEGRLAHGFRLLRQDFFTPNGKLRAHRTVGDEILSGLEWKLEHPSYNQFRAIAFAQCDKADLRRRVQRFREFINNEVAAEVRAEIMSSWFLCWAEDYELNEAYHQRLVRALDTMRSDPYYVLDYVLKQNPYRM